MSFVADAFRRFFGNILIESPDEKFVEVKRNLPAKGVHGDNPFWRFFQIIEGPAGVSFVSTIKISAGDDQNVEQNVLKMEHAPDGVSTQAMIHGLLLAGTDASLYEGFIATEVKPRFRIQAGGSLPHLQFRDPTSDTEDYIKWGLQALGGSDVWRAYDSADNNVRIDIAALSNSKDGEIVFFDMLTYQNSTLTPTGTTQDINLERANAITIDLTSATGDVTLTVSNIPTGGGGPFWLKTKQGATPRVFIWPANFEGLGGSLPQPDPTANGFDLFQVYFDKVSVTSPVALVRSIVMASAPRP